MEGLLGSARQRLAEREVRERGRPWGKERLNSSETVIVVSANSLVKRTTRSWLIAAPLPSCSGCGGGPFLAKGAREEGTVHMPRSTSCAERT